MRIVSVITAVLVLGTAAAAAMPPMFRQAEGRIIAVESTANRFTFERSDNGKRLALTWNRRTEFNRRASAGLAAMLRPGQTVRVSYRLPVFGPDYAGRIVVLAEATPK